MSIEAEFCIGAATLLSLVFLAYSAHLVYSVIMDYKNSEPWRRELLIKSALGFLLIPLIPLGAAGVAILIGKLILLFWGNVT